MTAHGFFFRGVKSNLVTRADFEKVAPLVDAISLMTYDFSEPNRLSKGNSGIIFDSGYLILSKIIIIIYIIINYFAQ